MVVVGTAIFSIGKAEPRVSGEGVTSAGAKFDLGVLQKLVAGIAQATHMGGQTTTPTPEVTTATSTPKAPRTHKSTTAAQEATETTTPAKSHIKQSTTKKIMVKMSATPSQTKTKTVTSTEAATTKTTAMTTTVLLSGSRMCLDLPGALLRGEDNRTFGGVNLTSPELCRDWCKTHPPCRQSVFTADPQTCQLFAKLTMEPTAFADGYNSSYCGVTGEQHQLLEKVRSVYKAKPYVPPNPNCSWSGDNCMESKCCADVCKANFAFTGCEWFTCYKKDEYFAGCKTGSAPANWNGTVLGGHGSHEVGKAPAGVLTQGTRLFCFSVVMWYSGPTMPGADGEGTLANNVKRLGKGIMQCDDHAFFDGQPTGSVHNIDSFVNAWNLVKADGRWKYHDWIVKVDADAVFFPERLKRHIDAMRVPQGSPVYLRNIDFKFHFMGALEVLSKEAMATYFERGWQCQAKLTKDGGEDYWLLQCLEGIGVNYVSDYQLLRDKYAAQNGCADAWAVAFHFHKSANDWNWCWNEAQNAWNAQQTTTAPPPAKVAA